MSLITKLNEDFIIAYKAKDMVKKDFLGFLKSELTRETKTPDDAYVVGKLKTMFKKLQESDSISELEIEVLNTYIPQQLNEDELRGIIQSMVFESSTQLNIGVIMKNLQANYAGQYDGKLASQLIRDVL
tara:strand:- start:362 stop:748 length:387 start_codon:yes stop_codon:yes gene_type:complete